MRTWAFAAVATSMTAAFLILLQLSALSDSAVTLVSNTGQLVAAVLASASCALASRRSEGQRRRGWRLLSVGTGCWALGQAVWSYYEVVAGREVPFPSLADVGFLGFPLIGGVGLLIWCGAQSGQVLARGRDLMDGAIIAVGLLVLSWVTVMAPVVETTGFGYSLVLSLAYPLGDVVLCTLVLITLIRSRSERVTLGFAAVGVGGFALADSLFLYLTTRGTYSSTDLVSSGGWVLGFLFIAVSGLSVTRGQRAHEATEQSSSSHTSWPWLVLPYLPLAAAGVALCADLLTSRSSVLVDLVLSVALVVMVLTRQFLAIIDNQRLLRALGEAGRQLEYQAMHDALTGLPNRALFAKSLDRALLDSSSNVDVLFCDLDNFKDVNDELGHGVGDRLLKVVAERLLGCVRLGDTVARLGGDEFAILLEDCPDAREVADRVVASMDAEAEVLGHRVRTSISVGLAHHDGTADPALVATHRREAIAVAEEREATAILLLRLADTAMYAAKSAGKGRAAALEADPVLAPTLRSIRRPDAPDRTPLSQSARPA